MTEAAQSIKIKRFEYVTAGPSTVLLRFSGKPRRLWGTGQRPTLRIGSGPEAHRFAAIPAPDDPRGLLRAAYSVPASLLGPTSTFWLEYDDSSLTELPDPIPGPARNPAHPAPTGPRPDPKSAVGSSPTELPAEIEKERRGSVLEKFAEQSAALARSEQTAAQGRREAANAYEHVSALEQRNRELEQALDEHRARITSLEQTVDAGDASVSLKEEIAALQSGRLSLEQELDESAEQVRVLTVKCDELTGQVAAFDAVAVEAYERADQAKAANEELSAQLSELEALRIELERQLAATPNDLSDLLAAREAAQRELERLRAALARAQDGLPQPEGLDDGPPDDSIGDGQSLGQSEPDVELISRIAERAAREQAERELRGAQFDSWRSRRTR